MIPRNHQNRKQRVDLSCPGCGLNLVDRSTEGFVQGDETFCCKGCAQGTRCTCEESKVLSVKGGNRRGRTGRRNSDNSVRDENQNGEVTSSGRVIGKRKSVKNRKRTPRRGDLRIDKTKIARSQSEERPSTREVARGRSEVRGKMTASPGRKARVDRIAPKGG